MVAPADKAVVCPVLVGRAAYVEALDRLIEGLAAGRGQTVTIAGEAGIGKSRLVAETKARLAAVRGDDVLVLEGHCFEPDATLPYAPLLDLLRACLATHPREEIVQCMGPDAPELVKLLPDLAAIIPGLEPAPPLEPEQEKRRLFHGLTQFFSRLSALRPVLMIVEDVHWSDDTSLEYLVQLARHVATQPLLLLLTYRSDEVHPALGHVLARLERERLLVEWPLSHLQPADVDEMIRAIFELRTAVPRDFLDAIYSLTEGNPFFIEEVLKSLVASGDIFYADGAWDRKPMSELRIPRSVHDAVRVRTEQLSPDAQQVLTIAAVTGRRFDFALLQRVAGCDEGELLRVIKEMIGAQLVVEESADNFSFRHALTQHVVSGDLLARERRSLHQTIAEHMRQLYASSLDAHLPELAQHFYEAGSWDEAYYYCRRVGENAQTLFASSAAVEHLTRALEAAGHLGVAAPAKLYRARGQSHELLGDFESARMDYEQSLEAARLAKDGAAEWQALIDLGFLWAGRDYQRTGDLFRRATDLARSLDEPALVAQSLNRLGNWLANTGASADALEAHRDALAIFERLGDLKGRADTLDLTGMALGLGGNIPASVAAIDAAVTLYRELNDTRGLISALSTRGTYAAASMHDVTVSVLRPVEESARDADEALRLARQIGWSAGQAYAEFTAAAVYGGYGEFAESLSHGHESLRIAEEISHEQWACGARFTLGQLYVSMQCPDLALYHLEEAAPVARRLGSEWWTGNVTTYLALAYLQKGDTRRARAALGGAEPPHRELRTLSERRVVWAWGEVLLAEGDAAAALVAAERALASEPSGEAERGIPRLLCLEGRALSALGRAEEAERALLAARRSAGERGERPQLWQVERDLAALYRTMKRSDEAAAAAETARAVIDELAQKIDDPHLREQFLQAATQSLPAKRPPSALAAQKAAFGGLTAREREVAALIARGKSNRDIAEALVLGERTIETHVGNILSKLGFSSRAQVAAWAVESGLLASAG